MVGGRWPRGSLLGALPESEQAGLVRLGTQRRPYDRGEVLIHEGEPDRVVYLLLRGCVKVVSTSAAGQSTLLAVRLEGDVVGELAALDDLPRSATVITAASPTVVCAIGHETFLRHLAEHPVVAETVRRTVVAKLRQATRFRAATGGASATVRLARMLAQLGERYGRDSHQGRLLAVNLTQPDLAALIGSADSTVERALKDLRERGLIRAGYRQILIPDPTALAALALETG